MHILRSRLRRAIPALGPILLFLIPIVVAACKTSGGSSGAGY